MGVKEVFGLKSEEETGNWRKFHDEELHDLYASVNFGVTKPRGIKYVEHVTRNGETICAYRVLTEKQEGNRQLGRTRCGWERNI